MSEFGSLDFAADKELALLKIGRETADSVFTGVSCLSPARGTTSLTRPTSAASLADMRCPVSSMAMALRNGICRCSRVMPPSSGMRPSRASGRPKLASSQATAMSQPSTISKPPPSA